MFVSQEGKMTLKELLISKLPKEKMLVKTHGKTGKYMKSSLWHNKGYNQALSDCKKALRLEVSEEKLADMLNEAEGLVYLEKSEDKIDRVHADVMKNNHKTSAKTIASNMDKVIE